MEPVPNTESAESSDAGDVSQEPRSQTNRSESKEKSEQIGAREPYTRKPNKDTCLTKPHWDEKKLRKYKIQIQMKYKIQNQGNTNPSQMKYKIQN